MCNYYLYNDGLLKQCDKKETVAVTVGIYCFLFEKTVKSFVQRHVLVQSPPDQHTNDKYPDETSHRSDLCKNVSLQCLRFL